jgi:hypothetical protein
LIRLPANLGLRADLFPAHIVTPNTTAENGHAKTIPHLETGLDYTVTTVRKLFLVCGAYGLI